MIQTKIVSDLCFRHIAQSTALSLTIALGLTGGMFALGGRAQAVETIRLVYETDDAVVSLDDIRSFAQTGQPPAQIEQFLLDNGQPAEVIARLLSEEITLSENLRQRLRADLEGSSVGRFVLYEIDKIVQGSGDLTALKAALDASMEDRTISILEVLENYSNADQVTLNLVGLRQTYTNVKAFIERVIPALEVAKDYLQNIICECEAPQQTDPQQTDPSSSPQSQLDIDADAPTVTVSTGPCLNPTPTAQSTSDGTAVESPQMSALPQRDRMSASTPSQSSQR